MNADLRRSETYQRSVHVGGKYITAAARSTRVVVAITLFSRVNTAIGCHSALQLQFSRLQLLPVVCASFIVIGSDLSYAKEVLFSLALFAQLRKNYNQPIFTKFSGKAAHVPRKK